MVSCRSSARCMYAGLRRRVTECAAPSFLASWQPIRLVSSDPVAAINSSAFPTSASISVSGAALLPKQLMTSRLLTALSSRSCLWSISVRSCPSLHNCRAIAIPILPAPATTILIVITLLACIPVPLCAPYGCSCRVERSAAD